MRKGLGVAIPVSAALVFCSLVIYLTQMFAYGDVQTYYEYTAEYCTSSECKVFSSRHQENNCPQTYQVKTQYGKHTSYTYYDLQEGSCTLREYDLTWAEYSQNLKRYLLWFNCLFFFFALVIASLMLRDNSIKNTKNPVEKLPYEESKLGVKELNVSFKSLLESEKNPSKKLDELLYLLSKVPSGNLISITVNLPDLDHAEQYELMGVGHSNVDKKEGLIGCSIIAARELLEKLGVKASQKSFYEIVVQSNKNVMPDPNGINFPWTLSCFKHNLHGGVHSLEINPNGWPMNYFEAEIITIPVNQLVKIEILPSSTKPLTPWLKKDYTPKTGDFELVVPTESWS